MAESPTGLERRMVHRLLIHWRNAQKDKALPSLEDVLWQDLGKIIPMTYVLKIQGNGGEPTFQRVGDAFAGELPEDLIGKPVSLAPENTLLSQAVRYYAKVLAKKVPITMGGEFTHSGGDTILYRSTILPLSSGEGEMERLLGAANCKVKE